MSRKMAVVLAAGMGTRMKSQLPKVLVEVLGRPMIDHVLDALDAGGVEQTVVVVGYRADDVRTALRGRPGVVFALQAQQKGTGHAVMVCRDQLQGHEGAVLVVAGDCPMMQAETITTLLQEYDRRPAACILGTVHTENPTGLGRIIRGPEGEFVAIVEEKDATDRQRRITEINMSYYVFNCRDLLSSMDHIRDDNKQGEYYLTDCPGVLKAAGAEVRALNVLKPCEALSINTIDELAAVEAAMAAGSTQQAASSRQ